ncbi:hypothetical protein SKAU_G00235160 [Synaphobranchus kaupii]|uniref:Uncharacterized protein n=1 Tax=Synaphobranchus kaupii TaxID=118154 RepID=A0A9Q1F6J1_SYNKA|nr:hypothetical protein SKAU_G00235160 [Synaphobranchus kaupii]
MGGRFCRQEQTTNAFSHQGNHAFTCWLATNSKVALLRNEVAQLKQLLLAHKDCPVTAMQKRSGYRKAEEEDTCEEVLPPGSPQAGAIQHSSVTTSNGVGSSGSSSSPSSSTPTATPAPAAEQSQALRKPHISLGVTPFSASHTDKVDGEDSLGTTFLNLGKCCIYV